MLLARIRKLRGRARGRADVELIVPSLEALLGQPRRQLLEYAQRIGLTGIHRLTKAALATRFRQEFQKLAARAGAQEPGDAPRKFDLGLTSVEADEPIDIPWGYGQDRVTAMAVDPERLYVYWEVTDEAIERARAELGPGGQGAWLNLRVYDVTNRIFDGTNAHHYFDLSVARTDRQWFFFIAKPSSTVVAEVGLKSKEGYFVRVARSGRADFPRLEPAPPGRVEWLTVLSADNEVGEPAIEDRQTPAIISGVAGPMGQQAPLRVWDIRRTHGAWDGEGIVRDESFAEWEDGGAWVREQTIECEGPIVRTTWEAGPFLYPVEAPRYVEERYEGTATVSSVDGRVHVVYGPWRVEIRGLGARAERRILAVWEVHRSWTASAGPAARTPDARVSAHGASEQLARGASELHWLAASELRLRGASEIHFLGASEVRLLGASETLHVGASERRARGASEQRYLGASEWRELGGSEARYAGASERLHLGASERARPTGASENRPRYPAGPSEGG